MEHESQYQRDLKAFEDHAVRYSHLVSSVGYAGFFLLLEKVSDIITPTQVVWSALIMIASVTSYVLYEVWSTFRMNISAKIAVSAEALSEEQRDARRALAARFGQQSTWGYIVVLVFSISTALISLGILVTGMVEFLLTHYASA